MDHEKVFVLPQYSDDFQGFAAPPVAEEQPLASTSTIRRPTNEDDGCRCDDVQLIRGIHAMFLRSWKETYVFTHICVKHKKIRSIHGPLSQEGVGGGHAARWPVGISP